jgi:peptidoglycan/LPS O-acetylase OafA/YrhL
VTLLLVAILQTLYFMKTNVYFVFQNNDIFHFILQLFFASGWGIDNSASFNQPIWSISVEIIVYLIFFLILRFVSQSILSCLAIILLCLIAQLNHIASWIIDCLALFYLGGFTACVASDLEKTKHSSSVYVLASGVLFVTPILLLAIHGQWIRYNIYIEYIYVGVLLFVMGKKINFNFTIEKMISNMGNMTYSSYLIHFPLQLLITLLYLFLHKNIPYYNKTFFIGFIIGTFVLAHYIYKWFELPMQNYIRRNYYLKNTSPLIESNVFVR